MKAYLSRRYRFSASHRLHVDHFSDTLNQQTFGKCNNPCGHGHNYVAQVTFSGTIDPETGMVANLADLDRFAQEHLLARFDHTNLNTLDLFENVVPTTENFAIAIERIFRPFPHAHLENVHVEETGNNSFDFAGGTLPAAGRY
jgi:6-pyruvoyltetrahydropterin/6-carboxytetrahydropterin synthase